MESCDEGQTNYERPDLMVKVFNMTQNEFIKDMTKKNFLAK